MLASSKAAAWLPHSTENELDDKDEIAILGFVKVIGILVEESVELTE